MATADNQQRMFWPDMMSQWVKLPARLRQRMARSAGRRLHALWRQNVDISKLPLDLTRFRIDRPSPEWEIPEAILSKTRTPPSCEVVRQTLVTWHLSAGHPLSRLESAIFVGAFFAEEGLRRDSVRDLARELEAEACHRSAQAPDQQYSAALKTQSQPADGLFRGYWSEKPDLPAPLLAAELAKVENEQGRHFLKKGSTITVFRANLFGIDVLVKRYDMNSLAARLRYAWRASRGRRAWAAGEALRSTGIPTPNPYGFLEIRNRLPLCSYSFMAFEADAMNARQWMHRYWRKLNRDGKAAFRAALQTAVLKLYGGNIYHADTKLANLMVRPAKVPVPPAKLDADGTVPVPGPEDLLWIDLECVRFGAKPTPHRICRNLVQMNGSVRNAWVTEAERMEFLQEMARHFPFLSRPNVVQKLKRWTLARWHKELRTRCAP